MTSYDTLNIAVAVNACNVQNKLERGTYHSIASAINANKRYSGAKASLVPWDGEDAVDWTQYSHIILASGITYAHCPKEFIAWMDGLGEPMKNRVFNSPHIIKWNMDKKYLIEMKNKGIRIPASVFIEEGRTVTLSEVLEHLNRQIDEPLSDVIIVKSKIDAGGFSTVKLTLKDMDTASETFKNLLQQYAQAGLVVQEYLETISSEGEWSIIFFDKKISHVVLKTPMADGFKVQGRFGGSNIPIEIHDVPDAILAFAEKVINVVEGEKILYARVDIVRNKHNIPCLMELEAFEPDLYLSQPELAQHFLETISSY